jgi:hypothetical protein
MQPPKEKEDRMAESVRLLASLSIDGRPVRCDHAVLLSEPPADEWLVALLGVAERDLDQLAGQHVASLVDSQGRLLQGAVEVAAGQLHSHVRLQGAGPLRELAPLEPSAPHAETAPHSYALLTRSA